MIKFYTLSPQGVPENPILFPILRPVFESKGHSFVDNISECDIVLFDLHVRQFDYDQRDIDYAVKKELPVISFDEWDRMGMSEDYWPYPLTPQMADFWFHLQMGMGRVHFCRLMDETLDFPDNVYPYEKPIIYEENICTSDELFNRQYDIAFVANSAPSRLQLAKAFESDKRLNCIISIGQTKIPFDNFVNVHRQAKFFVSSGAGGATDERKQSLFSISASIIEKTNQLLANPFTHLENCIHVSNPITQSELDTIFEYCNDKEKLYTLYKNNYDFMKSFYSSEYIANDILTKILKHCA